MPTKEDISEKEKCLDLFLKIGLDERTAKNTIANNKVTTNLTAVIHEAAVTDGCTRTVGNLIYTVATKYPGNALPHRPTLLEYVVSSKVKTTAQLDAALSFLANTGSENLDVNKFEEACGVGVEVSTEDIKKAVNEVFEENKASIIELRYRTNVGELLGHVRKRLPWADAKAVKQLADAKLYELLGDKTEADNEKPSKKKKEKPAKVEDKAAPIATPEKPPEEDLNPFLIFPSPEENLKVHTEVPFSDGTILRCCNTKALLDKHLKATGGKVLTRFPPEPNGYLHIGHAKAMFIDFGLAKDRDGGCYLRYDDTNPEAEKKEYIDHIEEIVQWMGWKPFKITYTSDYFQELYDLAVELIRRGCAYVDHQTPEEIKEYREKKLNSPWRDRPISESLNLFEDMRRGLVEEGKATLRMKQDMQSDNYNMYDLIAYRIKFTPHPHAGDKWCIYPSYDYAHCIVDSLENVTHSLCTLEFETRRASYYWLLHALGIYQPYVWEYSRLNISNTVMSKRKLNRLVTEKWVDGWDDPRLMTLAGLRRRGMTSTAINSFVRGIGITRSDGTLISVSRLEYHVREELNKTAPRTMVVLHPLKVVITNLEANSTIEVDAKKWPDAQADDSSAFYKIPFSNVLYIERTDFRMKDSKDYYGLAPGKSAILRYAFPIKCTEVILADDNETILEIRAEYDPSKKTKPKGVLHWVAQPAHEVDPLKVEVRLFDRLFLSENPAELDNWLGVSILRAVMVSNSHCQSQPLIHYISSIDENAKRRKRVVFSSSHSSELNPVIRSSEVSFSFGTCLIPHPKKVEKGGEDAFFVSNYNGGVIAVADGVSGWAEEDVDPSLFPRELMANAYNFVQDEEVNNDPQILIRKAHAATFSTGSATVIVAMLEKNGNLKIANVGDCGLRVIRNGQVIFSTSPQEHYFDCPYQLSSERVGQTYLDAMVSNVELMEGDTIVMGSDGLFDNVFDHEIALTVANKEVSEAAKALANLANSHSMDSNFDSPYSLEARAKGFEAPWWKKVLGMKLTGGKLDDITVVVGQVVNS